MVIPCLCSFTVPSSPFAEPPVNKKRTRTLFRKESGSSTNCMVELRGLEQKRTAILEPAGLKNASFRDILAQEDEDGRERLTPLFEELHRQAEHLRNAKDSADRILKVRLHQISLLSPSENGPHYDHYG